MKPWQIYTLLGLLVCLVTLQMIHVCVHVNSPISDSNIVENKQSILNQHPVKPTKKTNTYDKYYWMELSKNEMTTTNAVSRALDFEREGDGIDIMTASDMAWEIHIPSGATYMGTLYENDDNVYIIIKKTVTIKNK